MSIITKQIKHTIDNYLIKIFHSIPLSKDQREKKILDANNVYEVGTEISRQLHSLLVDRLLNVRDE